LYVRALRDRKNNKRRKNDAVDHAVPVHKPAFDPINSLVPVAQISIAPFGLIVHPSVTANSVAEFVALARAKPDAFSYGSSGTGGLTHLITEMFAQQAGVRLVHVPYKSTGAALPDFLSGTIQTYVGNVSPLLQHINSGKLKLLAVTNAERWPLLPEVPTIAETLPGFSADPWFGLFVPRGTPPDVIELLNATVNKLQREDEIKKNLAGQGLLPKAGTPAAFGAIVRKDYARWTKVVQDIGFKPD
jgi:tripartite-type tricarboxylate transporter receptor subunit TctC